MVQRGKHRGERVVVVTGGAAGIGAAIAESLGRTGAHVVTLDPMLSLDGATKLAASEPTTAERIVAAGGAARASNTSVTDADAVRALVDGLVEEFGAVDAVVNAAGISRPTDFAGGTEVDWAAVLDVHLGGYVNVLNAALPHMVAAGHGRVLGVTSGSGWRPANTGAYGCAKRAVAALTWQLGNVVPNGVSVNALSPMAETRMVTAAAARSAGDGSSTSGGVALTAGTMTPPAYLGPVAVYLLSDAFSWCRGAVMFSSGVEIAPIAPPRLLEATRSRDVVSLATALETFTTKVWLPAEANQATNGAGNPRFGAIYDTSPTTNDRTAAATSCLVITDDPAWRDRLRGALDQRSVSSGSLAAGAAIERSFAGAAAQLASVVQQAPVDAIVIALNEDPLRPGDSQADWQAILSDHATITQQIHRDVAWIRAASDLSTRTNRPVRVVVLTNASSPGGRSRAQAVAQLTRASHGATSGRVSAFALAVESNDSTDHDAAAALIAHLVCTPEAADLAGAELVAGSGWLGLRRHPDPVGSISFGGPEVPEWVDAALRNMVERHPG